MKYFIFSLFYLINVVRMEEISSSLTSLDHPHPNLMEYFAIDDKTQDEVNYTTFEDTQPPTLAPSKVPKTKKPTSKPTAPKPTQKPTRKFYSLLIIDMS